MMKNIYILIFSTLLISSVKIYANVSVEQTARLKSTGGVGVGAVLLDEATLLNPAPMAFYQIGAVYYQKTKLSNEKPGSENTNTVYIASDSKGPVGGSVSYQQNNETKLINVSLATPVSDKSAMGVTYRSFEGASGEKSNSIDIGVSHAISPFFTLGALVKNPQRQKEFDTRFILGSQFVYKDFISIMLDIGSDWENTLSSDMVYGAGLQFKTFQDFYLRLGSSYDRKLKVKNSGVGLSWVSPKILVNLSVSNIEEETTAVTTKDSSFSVSYKF